MENMLVNLELLIKCLAKKEKALAQIVAITENQGFLLESNIARNELYPFFMQMNEEKSNFIKLVMEYDQVFENVFRETGPALDAEPTKYGAEVQEMQRLIRIIMDLDVQIRVKEDENSKILTQIYDSIKPAAKTTKPAIDSGEYGSAKTIEAYKNQDKRNSG
ncbi:MAG: hypothetical protein FWG65_12745 [Turicibacter sp.]|nr:hypothetical protein [Turicibacter sp.]